MKVGIKMTLYFKKPLKGKYLDVSKASDEVFSNMLLGPGFIVRPTDKHIFSPVTGIVKIIYPTKHAIAISTGDVDILIHVGLTDKLRHKEFFNFHVELGDKVDLGDKLMSFNFDFDDLDPIDYETPIVFVQKKSLEILSETGDGFELIIK